MAKFEGITGNDASSPRARRYLASAGTPSPEGEKRAQKAVPFSDRSNGQASVGGGASGETGGNSSASSKPSSGFADNPLSAFDQVAYHFTFSVMNPLSGQSKIIAESGVTSYNIREVEIFGLIGMTDQMRNRIETQVKIVIVEPVGTSFLDNLYDASLALKIENWQRTAYMLSLKFRGYTPDGGLVTEIPVGGAMQWRLIINDVDLQFDQTGSVYTLTCIVADEIPNRKEYVQVHSNFSPKGKTIAEVLTDLTSQLNADVVKKYASQKYTISGFEFVKTDAFKEDPSNWQIKKPTDPEFQPFYNLSLTETEKDVAVTNIMPGMLVSDIITFLIANTEEGRKFIKDSKGSIPPNEMKPKEFRDSIVWMVYPKIQFTEYDWITEDYKLAITWIIQPYKTQTNMLNANEIALDPDGRKSLAALQSHGGLGKAYFYYFTGLNTEVVECNINYNLKWASILPNINLPSWSSLGDGTQTHAKVNPQTVASSADLAALQRTAAGQGTAGPTAANGLRSEAVEARLAQEQARAATTLQGVAEARQSAFQSRYEALAAELGRSTDAQYIEDLPLREENKVKVSVSVGVDNARVQAGSLVGATWHRDMSVFGALVNQSQMQITNSLTSISLKIKGDPYWLGTSYEEMLSGKRNPEFMNPTQGDMCFALIVRFPFTVDEFGAPVMRRNDILTALYKVVRVTSNFADGQFTQRLEGLRMWRIPAQTVDAAVRGAAGSQGGGSAKP